MKILYLMVVVLFVTCSPANAKSEENVPVFYTDFMIVVKSLNGDEALLEKFNELMVSNHKRFIFLNEYWWEQTYKHCQKDYELEVNRIVSSMSAEERRAHISEGNNFASKIHKQLSNCRFGFISDNWLEIKKSIELGE